MCTIEREAGLAAKKNLKRGAWTREEDERLSQCVKFHGETRWRLVPSIAGLNRCPRSCRMRWLNYLRPTIKRGNITEEEEDLIIRLHKLLGNRWALIAGRLPGRTDNEIKNYWKTHLSKKIELQQPPQKQSLGRCKSELVEERNGLTPIDGACGCDEPIIEPTVTAEAGVSLNEFKMEQILSVDEASMDCCFCNSSTEERATYQSGCIKHKAPSDGDAIHGFDCGSLNDYDFCMGMNLDSDVDFQLFIRSLCCEEA